MKRVLFAMAIVVPAVVVSLNACKKEESTNAAASSSASAAAVASGATSLTALTSASADTAVLTPTADPDKLPPPSAAANQAASSVSTATYKADLDAIEKELNGIK